MSWQLNFDGGEVESVPRRSAPLAPVQRAIMQAVNRDGQITSTDAGRIAHQAREDGVCAAKLRATGRCCPWVSSDGTAACKRLMERGYLLNPRRGVWTPSERRATV